MSGADRPAIVIAAGGAGLRLGGNKPARVLAGRSLLDHMLGWARASSDCLALAVASGGGTRGGLPMLPDARPDLGPIAALASAFAFATAQGRSHVMLVACDMPLLPADLAPRLAAAVGAFAAAIPATDGLLHPLAALWRADEKRLAAYIEA
ncbi:MAG TPA: NTP transferase domain-containing protein, partial [Novosphingobium sp.]